MNTKYRNASVIMAGIACLLVVSELITRNATDSLATWRSMAAVRSLSIPILFCWIGLLLRAHFATPRRWVKALLFAIIPASYLMWTLLHHSGIWLHGDGERCIWLYCAILGFMIPPGQLEECAGKKGWLELVLFLASAFCYCGITRVENHFGIANYQMLTGEGTRLFCRAMRFIPLAMSLYFLTRFSFSVAGQAAGNSKSVGWAVQVLAVVYFLLVLRFTLSWSIRHTGLIGIYRLLSQPVMVYLAVGIIRLFGGGRHTWKGDLFPSRKEAGEASTAFPY